MGLGWIQPILSVLGVAASTAAPFVKAREDKEARRDQARSQSELALEQAQRFREREGLIKAGIVVLGAGVAFWLLFGRGKKKRGRR